MSVSRRSVLLLTAVAAVLVGVGAAGASVALADDEVPKGVRVEGTDLSGLSRSAAEARITALLQPRAEAPVRLRAGSQQLTLDPRRAGLTVDAAAMAQDAVKAAPVARLRALFGGQRAIEPVPAVDEARLSAALRQLARKVDRAPREGAISYRTSADEPAIRAVLPVTGRTLDVAGATEAVREDWFGGEVVEVPVRVQPVTSDPKQVQAVLDGVAEPAIAAPITVVAGDETLVVRPRDIARALRFELDASGELVPRLVPDALEEQVASRLRRVGNAPVDATFRIAGGKPVVVPSKGGKRLRPADLVTAVRSALSRPAPRRVSAPLTPAAPRVTTEKARALGVKEVIGSFTTRHPCCQPRVQNIHRMADIVDGHVVLPGERFDLNGFVGPRDRARGFVDAPQILDGEFVDRVGGGVSQFATTLFNAVFFSGLKDITHSPHSYYISRYPPGREATVSFPKPDLIFENDSPHGVLITTSYTGTSITVTFWGTKRFDKVESVTGPRTRLRDFVTRYVQRDDCTATAGERGFDVVVTRVFKDGGRVVRRERFSTRYLPEPRFICGPPPRR